MRNTIVPANLIGLLALLLVGCASRQYERFQYVDGLLPVQDAANVEASTKAQLKIYEELKKRAGLAANPTTPAAWAQFAESGFDYIDERCDQYLDALFWYDRYRSTLQSQLSLTGATAASIMGVVDVAAKPISTLR